MNINFIQQFRLFMEYGTRNKLSSHERVFFIGLFSRANELAMGSEKHGWPEDYFPVANSEMTALTGMDERAIRNTRNSLMQRGLLSFRKGRGRKGDPEYRIHYLCRSGYQVVPKVPDKGAGGGRGPDRRQEDSGRPGGSGDAAPFAAPADRPAVPESGGPEAVPDPVSQGIEQVFGCENAPVQPIDCVFAPDGDAIDCGFAPDHVGVRVGVRVGGHAADGAGDAGFSSTLQGYSNIYNTIPEEREKKRETEREAEAVLPPSHPIYPGAPGRDGGRAGGTPQPEADFAAIEDGVRERIGYDDLLITHPDDGELVDNFVDLLAEVEATQAGSVSVAGGTFPASFVRSRMRRVGYFEAEYALGVIASCRADIRDPRRYVLTVLFNSVSTMHSRMAAKVSSDGLAPRAAFG